MGLYTQSPPGMGETVVYRRLGVLSGPRPIHGLEIEVLELQPSKALWIKIGLRKHKL